MNVVVLGSPATVSYKDSANLDAFSRLRVSEPITIFDSKQLFDNQPLFWDDQQTSGSGTTSTYIANQSMTNMSVLNVTAGTRVRQTFERFNYQPGKSLLIVMTGVLGTGATGVTRRIGYFDGSNGLFFQLSGTTLSVVTRTFTSGAAVDTAVDQSSWNIDKLNGTGTSGITIDTSKTQIFIIDFQWLGVGRVRFGVNVGGNVIYVHQVVHANVDTIVYMSSPNLPLRYEISNDGTGATATLSHICACIISEGGHDLTGLVFSVDTGAVAFDTLNNTSIYPLIATRLKSTALSSMIDIVEVGIINTTGDSFRYVLLLNPTVTGSALVFTGVTSSAIEAAAAQTSATTVTGGINLASGYVAGTTSTKASINIGLQSSLRMGASIANVSDIAVLGVQRLSGTVSTFYGQLSWRERI